MWLPCFPLSHGKLETRHVFIPQEQSAGGFTYWRILRCYRGTKKEVQSFSSLHGYVASNQCTVVAFRGKLWSTVQQSCTLIFQRYSPQTPSFAVYALENKYVLLCWLQKHSCMCSLVGEKFAPPDSGAAELIQHRELEWTQLREEDDRGNFHTHDLWTVSEESGLDMLFLQIGHCLYQTHFYLQILSIWFQHGVVSG